MIGLNVSEAVTRTCRFSDGNLLFYNIVLAVRMKED
jgi:hypothetical protein